MFPHQGLGRHFWAGGGQEKVRETGQGEGRPESGLGPEGAGVAAEAVADF